MAGTAGLPSTCTSKGGLPASTKDNALEMSKSGITVIAVSLSVMNTEIYTRGVPKPTMVEALRNSASPRAHGRAPEAAQLVALASESVAHLHGANCVIDGRVTLGISRATHVPWKI